MVTTETGTGKIVAFNERDEYEFKANLLKALLR
jgi:hypothetical protein